MSEEKIIINDEFLLRRPLSQSSLKAFKKSPKHYIQYLTTKIDTEPFTVGRLIDCLALEPEKFDEQFLIYEKFEKRTNDAKEKWQQLLLTAKEKNLTLASTEQKKEAMICVDALYSNNDARKLLEAKINVQKRIDWKEKSTNLPITTRIDFEANVWDSNFIVDLKTSADGQPTAFMRDIYKYGYNVQCGSELLAYQKKLFKFPEYLNLVVEKQPPYNVSLFYYDAKECQACKDEFLGLLKAFRLCMEENKFDIGYEFWLFEMHKFFAVNRPGYYSFHGIGVDK